MTTTVTITAQQPDIQYTPDVDKWRARAEHRLRSENLPGALPSGFPSKLDSDLVWEGKDIAERYNWTYVLTEADLEEIDAALQHFKALDKSLGFIDPETFPLPTLHSTLRGISRELHNGHGFKVVSGVPVDKYSREENIIVYVGISAHVAPIRGRQDSSYDGKPADVMLNHIKDLSGQEGSKGRIGAPAYTTDKQVFHTDQGDIISLFALNAAAAGGQSKLASSWRVYNELAETRPDLIRTLAENWPFDGFGNPQNPYHERPLLFHQAATGTQPERVVIQYARRSFTGFQDLPRSKNIPPITEAHAEALDSLHFLAEKFAVGLDFRKGDIQYINNLSIFHARDEFQDTPEQQRHLIRLWQRDPEYAWDTPVPLAKAWKQLYEGVTPEAQLFPLEPYIRSAAAGGRKHWFVNASI
ncbi:TauD/TfdA family dioxygenase [Aspergillus saccharolyticus JOP 1030-1]|uniref:Clavaminate synthase-like protein n=1 Tax=Aspergillus saccharolyticus JOP 1030-1 TaxID=1450539 RepID=A0A318ZSG5_9EURO|nr:Clavaminate synthase-like protein [Aspergillus saccharolyticus JOP 1030-1]PYH47303.1 Clavaminate synthase-like protein [Aspergillus saccharolyticus JOP 1030-1]